MKKFFYSILAVAAIVASCTKVAPINEEIKPVNPSGETTVLFTGTIIQPGGIDDATKVSIIEQDDDSKVYVKWTSGDKISIIKIGSDQWNSTSESNKPKVFEAASSEATTEFTGTPPNDWIAPGATYAARYYGKNDVWKSYVLACDAVTPGDPVEDITIDCNGNDEAAFLENMPLSCDLSQYDASNFRYNFTFSNAYAILQINVPSKLVFEDLYVCVNEQNVEFESGQLKDGSKYTLCLEGADAVKSTDKYTNKDHVTYFVPVTAGNYDKLTIVAAKDDAEVARMEAYVGNVKNGSDSPYALPQLKSNNIYPFDFCNTKTIDAVGEYELKSNNGLDWKVNIASDITGNVTINAEVDGKEPANIYINNRGHKIDGKLTINAKNSHVEGENGIATQVEAKTSNSTFVVKPSLTITGLTVKKGSVVVEGKQNKTANVETITIPQDVTEQIKIDVSGVSSDDEDGRVKIVNNSETPVVVVPDEVGDAQKSYTVEKGPVTPVSTETVAKIGETEYETLAAAISAATAGQTITLVSNIALDKEITISKGITIDGNNFTIAVSDADYWNQYKVGGANPGLGTVNMITVEASDFTLKNVTLDGKDCRGVSLCTTKSGENVLYQNITYTGRGSGHYYGEATGLVTFDGCKFDIHGYAVHFGGESSVDDDVVIKDCEVNGWSSFGFCKSLTITDSHFGGANDEGKNGWLAVLRPYCPTTITNCTFSDIYLHKVESGYKCIGLGTGAATTVVLKGCKIVNDAKQEIVGAEIYSIVRDNGFDNDAAQNGSVFAFDATGNATDGFTDGTFLAKDPTKISVKAGYEAYAIEGKTDIYGIREGFVAKIGTTGYKTLDDALKILKTGETLEILKAGEYTVQTLSAPANSIIEAKVEGVVFNRTAGGSVTSYGTTSPVTVKNLTWNLGSNNYQYFNCKVENCTINGRITGHTLVYLKNCNLINTYAEDYCVTTYGSPCTFENCTFSSKGKFVNVYGDEPNSVEIKADSCKFINLKSSVYKAAFNIKGNGDGKIQHTHVIVNNCTTEGLFPDNTTTSGNTIFFDGGLIMFDDPAWENDVYAVVDGITYYPYFTIDAQGNYSVNNVNGLKTAIKHWNALKVAGEKTITLAAGTYETADLVLWQNYAGKSLVIKAAESADVTVKPVASGNKSPYIFLVAGGSSYDATRAISFNGIKFDYTQAADITSAPVYCCQQKDPYVSEIEGIEPTNDTRYAHNITFNNCSLSVFDTETENISFIAGPSAGSPKDVAFYNCTMTNGGYIHSGYIYGIVCDNCTVTGVKALINSQSTDADYVITITNSTINARHDYVVRTSGGKIVVKDNVFTATYSGSKSGAGVVVVRTNATEATFAGNTFTKSSSSMWDCYCANACTVNNKARTEGTGINFPEPQEN